MSTPVIMTVAITGAVPTKTDKQAVPLTPLEPIEAAWAAYKQGASLVDIHVRNDDKMPSSDPHAARTLET